MIHFGFAIDPATNDLFLRADGNLAVVTGAEAVGQHARQRVKTYAYEWFLDTTVGVRWLDEIMGRGYNPALAEAVVKAEILGTDGVTSISSFSVSLIGTLRNLVIKEVEVETIYDVEVRL